MGKGIIRNNIGGGKYTVEIIYERTRIDAELLKLAEARAKLEEKLYTGTPDQDNVLRLQIASIDKRVSFLNEKAPQNVIHDIYCADFTDDLEINSEVGIIEIMRRPNPFIVNVPEPLIRLLLVIQPGFSGAQRYNAQRDGISGTSLSTSPAGAFWNLAMTPGFTRWKPRYRYGLISEIVGDYCSVQLTDLTFIQESASQIDIDQTPLALKNVPIAYMDCNGLAFEDNDEVIVEFLYNSWISPRVIGFTGPPEECQESYYYSAIFTKYTSDEIPTQSSDIYEKKYFKIWANGALEWVTDAEAMAQCNPDCFTITKQRPFVGLFEWSEGIDPMLDIVCDSEVLNANGPAVPYDHGIFTAIYNSGSAIPQPYPIHGKTIFEIDDIEFNIWQSLVAVCVESKAGATIVHKNNIRKVETETRRDEYVGYYAQTYQEGWWEATPQTFDLSTNWFGDKYGFISRYYIPPLANGGYIVSEYRILAYDQEGNEVPEADYAYFRFGRTSPRIQSFRHTLSFDENRRGSYSISTTPYKWDGPHPGGVGESWLNYAIGRRDGTIASDDYIAQAAGTYHLISTTTGVRNASHPHIYSDETYPEPYTYVYVAPCEISEGPIIIPYYFKAGAFGTPPTESAWNTMGGTLPRCVMRWTNETRELIDGNMFPKNIAEFPSAGEHYTEGEDIDNYVTHYFDYCGKYTESIVAIYYSLDEEHPTWLYLKVNFTQTSDDGNDLDEKTLSMTVERGTGRVIDSSVGDGFITGGTYVDPGSGNSIFPEARDPAAYTLFLYNKKVELGASTYYVARMMKKS